MSEARLFGGTLLDTPEKKAQAEALGPEHVAACAKCGAEFYRNRPSTDICYGCYYVDAIEQAENRFKPLSTWLERLLEVRTSVDQTGGMVMCLHVPIGRDVGEHGDDRCWAWFSEAPGDYLGFGIYETDEDGEYVDEEGVQHAFPGELGCHAGECGWYHHPDLCEQLARWAAPIIVQYAADRSLRP
jgi:hypothetical protein